MTGVRSADDQGDPMMPDLATSDDGRCAQCGAWVDGAAMCTEDATHDTDYDCCAHCDGGLDCYGEYCDTCGGSGVVRGRGDLSKDGAR